MKKAVCFFLVLVLLFGSTICVFAAEPDTSYFDGVLKYSGYSVARWLSNIDTRLSTTNTNLSNIYNALNGSSGVNAALTGISNYLSSTTLNGPLQKLWNAVNDTGGLVKRSDVVSLQTMLSTGGGIATEGTLQSIESLLSDHSYLSDFFSVNGFNLARWQSQSSATSNVALGVNDFMKFWVMSINDMERYFQTNSNSLLNKTYARYNSNLDRSNISLYNTADLENYAFNDISYYLSRLAFVLANDDDIAAREEMSSRSEAITEDFINSNGDNSVSLSDIGALRGFSSGVSDLGNFTVSPTRAVDMLNSDAPWEFLTNDTKYDIDPSARPRLLFTFNSVDSSGNDVYNFLDDNINLIVSMLNN